MKLRNREFISKDKETKKAISAKFMSKKKHRGSDFRDFLDEQGILGEVEARALKQALSLRLVGKAAALRAAR
jgi:hypothetical protein